MGNSFGFFTDDIHDINVSDIEITQDDYSEFFKMQSLGKQFKLKQPQVGATSLFDYIEEFEPEQIIAPDLTIDEMQNELAVLKNTIATLEKRISTL